MFIPRTKTNIITAGMSLLLEAWELLDLEPTKLASTISGNQQMLEARPLQFILALTVLPSLTRE